MLALSSRDSIEFYLHMYFLMLKIMILLNNKQSRWVNPQGMEMATTQTCVCIVATVWTYARSVCAKFAGYYLLKIGKPGIALLICCSASLSSTILSTHLLRTDE